MEIKEKTNEKVPEKIVNKKSCQCWISKENEGLILLWEDPLEEGMTTYTSILA